MLRVHSPSERMSRENLLFGGKTAEKGGIILDTYSMLRKISIAASNRDERIRIETDKKENDVSEKESQIRHLFQEIMDCIQIGQAFYDNGFRTSISKYGSGYQKVGFCVTTQKFRGKDREIISCIAVSDHHGVLDASKTARNTICRRCKK